MVPWHVGLMRGEAVGFTSAVRPTDAIMLSLLCVYLMQYVGSIADVQHAVLLRRIIMCVSLIQNWPYLPAHLCSKDFGHLIR